jgi:hypothetical protein
MSANRLNGLLLRLRGLLRRQPAGHEPASEDPALSPEIVECLKNFDDGLSATAKAWSSGALLSKVNPRRVERALEALKSRETLSIASLLVEIAAPDNAVSAVAIHTATNNIMREQFVRGVMGAVMAAIVDVEKAYRPGTLQAGALLERTRNWIARPLHRQAPGPGTADERELEDANDVLCNIAADILKGSDENAAAIVRLGMVIPLGVALQITRTLQDAPPSVLGLKVAGFEFASGVDDARDPTGGRQAARAAASSAA